LDNPEDVCKVRKKRESRKEIPACQSLRGMQEKMNYKDDLEKPTREVYCKPNWSILTQGEREVTVHGSSCVEERGHPPSTSTP
jgi:hypothetical protein